MPGASVDGLSGLPIPTAAAEPESAPPPPMPPPPGDSNVGPPGGSLLGDRDPFAWSALSFFGSAK